jgi:PAP2 superfamily
MQHMITHLRRGALLDAPAIFIALGYVFMVHILLARENVDLVSFSGFFTSSLMMLVLTAVVWLVFALVRDRPKAPIAHMFTLAGNFFQSPRLIGPMVTFLALVMFMPSFSAMKSAIPLFAPYAHDGWLIALDARLHGGPAWELFGSFFQSPTLIASLATAYHVWILLIFFGMPLVMFGFPQSELRLQLLIAFFLCWIVIGTVMAIALSSVGPCFLEAFTGRGDFRPLMDHLRESNRVIPVMTLNVQDELVTWKNSGSSQLGAGISAMPSMHVSMACLFTLLAWRVSKVAGMLLFAFLVVIQIGSVVLAYHYAVDGYVSLIATPVIWWASGRVASWWLAFSWADKAVAVTTPVMKTA